MDDVEFDVDEAGSEKPVVEDLAPAGDSLLPRKATAEPSNAVRTASVSQPR
jgi:hypothetical protein